MHTVSKSSSNGSRNVSYDVALRTELMQLRMGNGKPGGVRQESIVVQHVRLQVLTATSMKMTVFWDVQDVKRDDSSLMIRQ
jgi:hypothetical protein